jgi:hypothetical protein
VGHCRITPGHSDSTRWTGSRSLRQHRIPARLIARRHGQTPGAELDVYISYVREYLDNASSDIQRIKQKAQEAVDTAPALLIQALGGDRRPDWAEMEIGVMLRERRAWIDEVLGG